MNENKEYKKAINYICGLVESRQLNIGDKIPTERAIAQTLGISRNSTREALRTLENMGAVESRHGSGNYLSGNISKALSDMINMLMFLSRISPEEICDFRRSMDKAVCQMIIDSGDEIPDIFTEAFENSDEKDEADADRAFHYMLIHATGNRFWIELMDAISDVYRGWIDDVLRSADEKTKAELRQSHRDICEAVVHRKSEDCRRAIDRHYDMIDRERKRA